MLQRTWGKKKWKQNKNCRYISPRKHQTERERAFDLEESFHAPQNSPNGPLEELRNLGTDCMKSFELHKMLMVALSQASCWQLLRVSNNNSKISIYSMSLFSGPVCNTVPQIIHPTVFALFLLLTLNCAYKQVHSDLVKHSEHTKPDVLPLNSVVFDGDPALYKWMHVLSCRSLPLHTGGSLCPLTTGPRNLFWYRAKALIYKVQS